MPPIETEFFFSRLGPDLCRARQAARSRGALRRMHLSGQLRRAARSDHSCADGKRLRGRRSRGPALLRSARRARGRARCRPAPGARKSGCLSCARISTPSSPMPPAAARRSRNTTSCFPPTIPPHEKALAFRGKMRDVTEFLDELGLSRLWANCPLRVTYQDSCHLAHGQKIREAPRRLIRAIPGVRAYGDALGGSIAAARRAFTTSRRRETSLQLLAEKMQCAARNRAPKPSSRQIPAVFCRCAPEAKYKRPDSRYCTSWSCSTAPSPRLRPATSRQ